CPLAPFFLPPESFPCEYLPWAPAWDPRGAILEHFRSPKWKSRAYLTERDEANHPGFVGGPPEIELTVPIVVRPAAQRTRGSTDARGKPVALGVRHDDQRSGIRFRDRRGREGRDPCHQNRGSNEHDGFGDDGFEHCGPLGTLRCLRRQRAGRLEVQRFP